MDKMILTSIGILVLIALDATGDAFRANGRQILHHFMETLHLATWLLIWACCTFMWDWVLIYIVARIWLFDILFNLWKGNRILYVGENDFWGMFIRWISSEKVFNCPYEHTSFIFKLVGFWAWLGWTLKIFFKA